MQFKPQPAPQAASLQPQPQAPVKQNSFFRTMTAEEYKSFSSAVKNAPQPKPAAAAATAAAVERAAVASFREQVVLPSVMPKDTPLIEKAVTPETTKTASVPEPQMEEVQTTLPMPEEISWRFVGELYQSYILVEQGEDAFLIDKHAAHERILFEKLKENQEAISSQTLITPVSCQLSPDQIAILLTNREMLLGLGFEIDEFGDNTLLLRQIPMDLSLEDAADALDALAADLLNGRRESRDTVRDEMLHTVACKAAIKAGWHTDENELLVLAKQVMAREDLKYCPHGRPICISLSKKQIEKQFKRT